MNKKIILLVLISALVILVINLSRNYGNKDSEVLSLNLSKRVQVTAPIQFTASENVTAIEFKVTGDIVKVECVNKDFQTMVTNLDGCVMANFEGGTQSGTIGKITFIQSSSKKPVISGILGNKNGDNAKDSKIYIEY